MIDQILYEVNEITQMKTIPTTNEDEIRKYFSQISLSNNILDELSQLKKQEYGSNIVFYRIQITDILDSDVFIGAIKQNDQINIYPLGCEQLIEGQKIYFDKQTFQVNILDPEKLYLPSKQTAILSYHFNTKKNKPQIFNVYDVLAIKQQDGDDIFLNAITFVEIKPQINNNINLELFNQLKQCFNNIVQDEKIAQILCFHILISSKYETYSEGARQILNIYGISTNQVQALIQLIQSIYTPTLNISLSQEYLSNVETLSLKNHDTNQLQYGILTVPTNLQNQVIIDETQLTEGQISGKIIQNIQNIKKFIKHSKVGIDYTYSIVEIPVQTNILILSQGKTFLNCNQYYQINPINNIIQQNIPNLEPFIHYIHYAQQNLDINQELKKQINDKFVQLRQQNQNIDFSHLNTWILKMKILSLINGEQCSFQNFENAIKLQ